MNQAAVFVKIDEYKQVLDTVELIKKKRPEIHPNAAQIEGLMAFEKMWK